MKKIFIIGIMAAIFMIAIGNSAFAEMSYQGSPEAADSYVPAYPLSYQGGDDCNGSPECIRLRAEREAARHKSAKPYVVENPCGKNPCLQSIKDDTTAIRESVGDVDKTEPADEQTLQQKGRKTLKLVKETHEAVGKSKSGRSLHDKTGESNKKDDTVFGILERIEKKLDNISAGSVPWWKWLLPLLILLAAIIFATLYIAGVVRGQHTESRNHVVRVCNDAVDAASQARAAPAAPAPAAPAPAAPAPAAPAPAAPAPAAPAPGGTGGDQSQQ